MRALLLTLVASMVLAQQTEIYNPYADLLRSDDYTCLVLPPVRLPFELVDQARGDKAVLVVKHRPKPPGYSELKTKMPLGRFTTSLYDLESGTRFDLPYRPEIETSNWLNTGIDGRYKNIVLISYFGEQYLWDIARKQIRLAESE